jgi:dihydrofolate reductase
MVLIVKISLYIASSVDGYIARKDGSIAWLPQPGSADTDYGYDEFYSSIDVLLMGSRTYEQVLSFGDWPHADRPVHVFTSRLLPRPPGADIKFWNVFPSDLVEYLENTGTKHAWLVGGSIMNGAFLASNLITALIVSVIPIVLGDGIPLFPAGTPTHALHLEETRTYPGDIVQLSYATKKVELV